MDEQTQRELSLLWGRVRQAPTMKTFSLPYPVEAINRLLIECYRSEVLGRGGEIADASDFDEDTKAHVKEAAEWLSDENGKPGMYLCGNVGNGKTTLARAIQTLIQRYEEVRTPNVVNQRKLKYYRAIDIARWCIEDRDKFEDVKREEMIIIDDLGTEQGSVKSFGNASNPLAELLSRRYDDMALTIVTGNLSATEIEEKYGKRIRDRFREMLKKISFKNDSYRQ